MVKKTTPVRLEDKVVRRVRKYVKGTRQTIGGFISSEIDAILTRLNAVKSEKPVGNQFEDGRFDDTTAEAMNG